MSKALSKLERIRKYDVARAPKSEPLQVTGAAGQIVAGRLCLLARFRETKRTRIKVTQSFPPTTVESEMIICFAVSPSSKQAWEQVKEKQNRLLLQVIEASIENCPSSMKAIKQRQRWEARQDGLLAALRFIKVVRINQEGQ